MAIELSRIQMEEVYEALVFSVQRNTGIGFYNSDQGHAVYEDGARGESSSLQHLDSPETNELFQLLRCIERELGESCPDPQIDTWESFCKLAVAAAKAQWEH
jgi:hypothetical protein